MAKILGVIGSLRAKSHTRKLVQLTLEHAKEFGAEVQLLDLAETPLPMLDPDDSRDDPNIAKVKEQVNWAGGFILGSPDYHGSMSGPIVNFLDYFWPEFTGKLFGYVVASHEKGLTVQDQMRTAVRQCYGWSMPYGIGFNGDAELDGDGNPKDERLAGRCRMLGRDLVVYTDLIHGQFAADVAKDPRDPGFAEQFKG